MPPKFTKCVKSGGKVRTVKPNEHSYLHVCVPKGGGKSVSGEVKRTKGKRK